MIIVTGGAGFIGSALVWGLNQRGVTDILIVDSLDPVRDTIPQGSAAVAKGDLISNGVDYDPASAQGYGGHSEKEHNLAPLSYEELIGGDEFRQKLAAGDYDKSGIDVVLHMGAISSTTGTSWQRLLDTNVEFTQEVIRWCVDRGIRCVYASSGATYGDGSQGYSDDHALFDQLKPLNLYGKSKLEVDIWARDAGYLDPPSASRRSGVVGVRYFNVFGPNEYHKGDMRSVVAKKYEEEVNEGVITLFKSYRPDFQDGEQKRDFVYVKDVVAATLFFLDQREVSGVFNIGTGKSHTWNEVARAMFAALGKKPNIRYVDMPDVVKAHYQYFTQADITKLREAGFKQPMYTLEDAVTEYIQSYLKPHLHLGEEKDIPNS